MKDTDHSSSSNTALSQWQKNLCNEIALGGIAKGEMLVYTAGRGVGKSQLHMFLNNWLSIFGEQMPAFSKITGALVDGEQWYTVQCNKEVSNWVRTLDETHWYEHIDQRGYINRNIFDMHEKLYTMLAVKWS